MLGIPFDSEKEAEQFFATMDADSADGRVYLKDFIKWWSISKDNILGQN